eukprot:comp42740_c0_seq1/m.47464 comp42740_c0_seq1/g.47464  ORF comp42740_c0_seq1/g.47464 comp42740_c0_seq1/m.47464 type:complete len:203 (-) comp42740_c0_seq1:142-750(-)
MANANTAKEVKTLLADVEKAEEDLEDELDDFDVPAELRDRQMQQFKREVEELRALQKDGQHGTYEDIADTQVFLETTTKVKRVVCHFYHPEMKRCKIVDKHMEILCKKYYRTRFVHINVLLTPFLVEKLILRVLPTIVCFVDGRVVARIVGFEDFGNTDNFTTATFEKRLGSTGILGEDYVPTQTGRRELFGFAKKVDSDDE